MKTIDEDISKKIGKKVHQWVMVYKHNNKAIASKTDSSLDGPHARNILLKFIATVVRKEGEISIENFR